MEVHIMGSDQRSVRCARVSFARDEEVDPDKDRRLIRYLYRNRHASPFEHNIVAFRAGKDAWLDILRRLDNPTVQIYHSEGYVWLNLRSAINSMELLPQELAERVKERFPTTWAVVESDGTLEDEELSAIPYSRDSVFLREKVETSSGWIGLVDSLELGTAMDYYTFIVECPLFVARQWHRHRFGSYNEVSRRYTDYGIEFYIPPALRRQAKSNKQASLDEAVEEPYNSTFLEEIRKLTESALSLYRDMKEKGVARELARGVLPQFMKTRYYWTVPRISLDNFITLRTHRGAQREIREFAEAIVDLVGYRGTDRRNRL